MGVKETSIPAQHNARYVCPEASPLAFHRTPSEASDCSPSPDPFFLFEFQRQAEAEKEMIVQQWEELRGFLEEQKLLLVGWVELPAEDFAQRREESLLGASAETPLPCKRGREVSSASPCRRDPASPRLGFEEASINGHPAKTVFNTSSKHA